MAEDMCSGEESRLLDCNREPRISQPCDHSLDVGLQCGELMEREGGEREKREGRKGERGRERQKREGREGEREGGREAEEKKERGEREGVRQKREGREGEMSYTCIYPHYLQKGTSLPLLLLSPPAPLLRPHSPLCTSTS